MSRLRVGVVGLGGIAQMMHLPHLRELDDRFEIAALCDISPDALAAVGDQYRVEARYQDYRQLVRADLEAVFVLTAGTHAPIVLAALEAGRHVFVEKPLCYSPREADQIVDRQRETGLVVQVGYVKRHNPAYRHTAGLVRALEALRFVDVTVLHPAEEAYWGHHRIRRRPGPIQPTAPTFRAAQLAALEREAQSEREGALIVEAIGPAPIAQRVAYLQLIGSLVHDVNALRGLLGEPLRVVSTELWNDGLCMRTTLAFPNDVYADLRWIYAPEHLGYHEEIAFVADAGRVRLRFPSPFLRNTPSTVVREGTEAGVRFERVDVVAYEDAFLLELVHFHDCVLAGRTPETPAEDGRADLAVLREIALAWR